jgi:hypothetical protein
MIDGFSNHPCSQSVSQGDQKCFNIIQNDRRFSRLLSLTFASKHQLSSLRCPGQEKPHLFPAANICPMARTVQTQRDFLFDSPLATSVKSFDGSALYQGINSVFLARGKRRRYLP